jgi:hypothetical protein
MIEEIVLAFGSPGIVSMILIVASYVTTDGFRRGLWIERCEAQLRTAYDD